MFGWSCRLLTEFWLGLRSSAPVNLVLVALKSRVLILVSVWGQKKKVLTILSYLSSKLRIRANIWKKTLKWNNGMKNSKCDNVHHFLCEQLHVHDAASVYRNYGTNIGSSDVRTDAAILRALCMRGLLDPLHDHLVATCNSARLCSSKFNETKWLLIKGYKVWLVSLASAHADTFTVQRRQGDTLYFFLFYPPSQLVQILLLRLTLNSIMTWVKLQAIQMLLGIPHVSGGMPFHWEQSVSTGVLIQDGIWIKRLRTQRAPCASFNLPDDS